MREKVEEVRDNQVRYTPTQVGLINNRRKNSSDTVNGKRGRDGEGDTWTEYIGQATKQSRDRARVRRNTNG